MPQRQHSQDNLKVTRYRFRDFYPWDRSQNVAYIRARPGWMTTQLALVASLVSVHRFLLDTPNHTIHQPSVEMIYRLTVASNNYHQLEKVNALNKLWPRSRILQDSAGKVFQEMMGNKCGDSPESNSQPSSPRHANGFQPTNALLQLE